MDDPNCDQQELTNTYEQFAVINALISRWHSIYKKELQPACKDGAKTYSLLDIGFGGGDLSLKIAKWAKQDDIKLNITSIETDARAFEFVKELQQVPSNITFRHISSSDLLKEGKTFDFVISNHLLHHLTKKELFRLLKESKELSTYGVFFNDIERSDVGYFLFNILSRPLFRSSFITDDGLTSIRRSYTLKELSKSVPKEWQVSRIVPYRLLLSFKHHGA